MKLNSFQKDHLPNDTTEYKQEVAKKERKYSLFALIT